MKDISARELKGHTILAVERFKDSYQNALQDHQRRKIKIKRYARVVEGHILDFKPGKKCTRKDTPFAEGGTAFLRRTFLCFFFLSVSLFFACPHRII